jgi:ribosomal-protein-alanine N-acetyltransferase
MRPEDAARVAAIEATSFARPWSEEAFRHELVLPFSQALVAHPAADPGVVAGYAVAWHVADESHLLDLGVAPPFRRRGLGRLLAEAVVAGARARRSRLVTLEVATGNHAARALYSGLGFVTRELRRDYYGPGDDAIVMHLEAP